MSITTKTEKIKGGGFLIRETDAEEIFIPEEWSEEQRMIKQSCNDFIETEVYPRLDKLDSMEHPDLMPFLLKKTGQLGLLGTAIPEKYGGFYMDFNSNLLIAEGLGSSHSFIVAFSAHTGIGTTPILYFGNEEQKSKYLPKLATGEFMSAYCLTEPDAGSDANAGKTRATLSNDKKYYLLNGQKMWITNGGFADLLIVFAKIENDKYLSAFIVEKNFGGITMNPEEKKMGIKGSSTRQIFFNDCRVPVENLLGEREKGFKIALNILNIGRIKLAAATLGGSKYAIRKSIQYANDRKQFGKSIGTFGAIKHKLGEMASRTFAIESAIYRTGNYIQDYYTDLLEDNNTDTDPAMTAIEEFAIECAILKVHGSEVLDAVIDEAVQIHGGMGFSAEGPVERGYRDSRINRIFEGTNEINRLVTIDMLLKRAMKGHLDLMSPAMAVQKELTSIPEWGHNGDTSVFASEKKILKNLKKAGLMVAGAAVQKLKLQLKEEQEILMSLAEMLIEIYVAESAILRAEKITLSKGEKNAAPQIAMSKIYVYRAVDIITKSAKEAIYAITDGDEQRIMLLGLKRFAKIDPFNLKEARRGIADIMLEKNDYVF